MVDVWTLPKIWSFRVLVFPLSIFYYYGKVHSCIIFNSSLYFGEQNSHIIPIRIYNTVNIDHIVQSQTIESKVILENNKTISAFQPIIKFQLCSRAFARALK